MIYHLLTVNQFENHFDGINYGYEILKKNDFLHCCTLIQMKEVLDKHYTTEAEVLAFELIEENLFSKCIFENDFPHIYGIVNSEAIKSILRIERDKNGSFILPL
jgi:uncharacterized protein (DUF952 family)